MNNSKTANQQQTISNSWGIFLILLGGYLAGFGTCLIWFGLNELMNEP